MFLVKEGGFHIKKAIACSASPIRKMTWSAGNYWRKTELLSTTTVWSVGSGKQFLSLFSRCLFFQLFASNLKQSGKDDDEGLRGFLPNDIRKELSRAGQLVSDISSWIICSQVRNYLSSRAAHFARKKGRQLVVEFLPASANIMSTAGWRTNVSTFFVTISRNFPLSYILFSFYLGLF